MIAPPHQLLRLLRERGVHPKDVARDLGVNPATVYAWANHGVLCPPAKADRLAARLGVEPAQLGVVVKPARAPKPPKPLMRRGPLPGTVRHPERNAEMYRLREDGLTLAAIGTRFGMCREAVRLCILTHCRYTAAQPPTMPTDPSLAQAYRLRQQGLSWRAIGAALGCHHNQARSKAAQYTKAHGLRMPVVDTVHPCTDPERRRLAYELRASGKTWTAVGMAMGGYTNPAQGAVALACKHARTHNLPWPPKVTP